MCRQPQQKSGRTQPETNMCSPLQGMLCFSKKIKNKQKGVGTCQTTISSNVTITFEGKIRGVVRCRYTAGPMQTHKPWAHQCYQRWVVCLAGAAKCPCFRCDLSLPADERTYHFSSFDCAMPSALRGHRTTIFLKEGWVGVFPGIGNYEGRLVYP